MNLIKFCLIVYSADEKRSSVADDLTSEVLKELSISEPKEAQPLLQGKIGSKSFLFLLFLISE